MKKKVEKEIKLNLACGNHKIEDYIGVDNRKTDAADQIVDLQHGRWPWKSGTVSAIVCNYYFHYLTGTQRIHFMDECHRILKSAGKIELKVPYWSSLRAIGDPYVAWPPVGETTFLVFNKEWRQKNEQGHYPIKCDFDFGYGYVLPPELVTRNDDYKGNAVKTQINSVLDLVVTLTKRD